jgi:hypothetical protein
MYNSDFFTNMLETETTTLRSLWSPDILADLEIRIFFCHGQTVPSGLGPPFCRGFTITLIGHTTIGRIPLDE